MQNMNLDRVTAKNQEMPRRDDDADDDDDDGGDDGDDDVYLRPTGSRLKAYRALEPPEGYEDVIS
jgi:hypothetical protein